MCHIIGIEPQFKNIIENGPYVPMTTGQRKPKGQWTGDERKAANLDQRLKSLILFVLPDDQMNSDFQDSPDDKEDTTDNLEYLNDLEEEFQERALLAKSKRFFKKGSQGLVEQRKLMKQNAINVVGMKPELRPTKDFEAKYNKVKAKLALLSSSASAPKSSMVNNKGLVAKAYEWDEEEVSSDDNEMVEMKVLMALDDEENVVVGKESARNGVERHWLYEAEGFIFPNHDTGRILPAESQVKITDPLVAITDSSAIEYDSADESLVCSTRLPLPEKLVGVTINEPSSAPTKGNKSSSALKVYSAPAGKLKSVKIEDDPPLAIVMKELNNLKLQFSKKNVKTKDDLPLSIVMKELNDLKLQISKNQSSYSRHNKHQQHLKNQGVSSSRSKTSRPMKSFPPCKHCGFNDHQSDDCVKNSECEICRSYDHDTHGHNKWFRRGEAPQAKKAEVFQAKKAESSNATRSKTPTKSGCSRHMTCLKSYLHKYVEQSGPKVVFGDDSTCTTEGYGSIKCNGISDEKKGIIFNSNKEVVMIAPRVRDVYQVDSNVVQYIEPYKKPEPSVTEANASLDHDQANQTDQLDQNDLMDQNDHPVQADEILNDDQPEHSNHNNDNHIIDNLPNTKDDKHIELVNIIGILGARMLTKAMAKGLSAASAHEYLFVDFLSEEEPKKVFEAFKHPRWVDTMQEELNQFARNKVWTLVLAPYDIKQILKNPEMDIQEKDKNKANNDKTEHENEKSVKKQSKSKSQSQSQPRQSQVKVKVNSEKLNQKNTNMRDHKCQIMKLYVKDKLQGVEMQFK
ncbi:hypothetical protein Tco_0026850 [Tanacetum coccineum]